MKVSELKSDLSTLALGDNLPQGMVLYLAEIIRRMKNKCPIWIEGAPGSGKSYLVHKVMGLFRSGNGNGDSVADLYLTDQTDKAGKIIVGMDTSDSARNSILGLQRRSRTKEGFINLLQNKEVFEKHRSLIAGLPLDRHIFIPYVNRIKTGPHTTTHEQEFFLDLIEAVTLLDCDQREASDEEILSTHVSSIESLEEDFHAVKEILVHVPVFSSCNSLSPKAIEFAKDMVIFRDKCNDDDFSRQELLEAFKNKYETFKPIRPRLEELIGAGFVNIVKKSGYRNSYKYAFTTIFRDMNSEDMKVNSFTQFSLS